MSTYILQKDLPDIKKGAEFTHLLYNGIAHLYSFGSYNYNEDFIKNNPEWFKLKGEELVLPDRYFIRNGITFKLDKEIIDCVINIFKIKYTEEDMRKCWEACEIKYHRYMPDFYESFEDYINLLKK